MSIWNSLFGSGQSSSTVSPQLAEPARNLATGLIERTQQFANQSYTPYNLPREASFTPDQLAAFGTTRDIAQTGGGLFDQLYGAVQQGRAQSLTPMAQLAGERAGGLASASAGMAGAGDIYAQQAGGLAQAGLGITSQSVPSTLALAQRFPSADINAYMNPYTQAVLDPAMEDIARRSALERNALASRAAQTGSFGGSRNALAEQELVRNTMGELGRLSANERARAFNEAANQFRLDQANIPRLFEQAQGQIGRAQDQMGAAQTANERAMAARGTAQQQQIAAQQAAANLENLRGLGYSQLESLIGANQGRLGSEVNPLLATGGLQQALNQANLETAYRDFLEQRDWDRRGLQEMRNTLQGVTPGMTTQQTTSQAQTASPLSQVIGAGTGLVGLLGSTGAFKSGSWLSSLFGR